jgi:peptidoglycan hydrolase-like protein with peptidoglycan-binding domain
MNHGIGIRSPKPTGDYLPGTKQAVQKFQLAQG